MRTIITRKDDNGIIVYSHIFQLLYNLPYIYIQPIDHCSKCSVRIELSTIPSFTESRTSRLHSTIRLLGVLPTKLLNNTIFRYYQFGMRNNGRIPHKERLIFLLSGFIQKSQCFRVNQVLRISTLPILHIEIIVRQIYPFIVVPQMIGIIAVCQQLAIISVKLIDSLFVRVPRGTDIAKPPFTKGTCTITGITEIIENSL